MTVAILRSTAGNLQSVVYALDRIGVRSQVVTTARELEVAERVILPGVGEARSAMSYLSDRGLDRAVRHLQVPVLGICLGLQLMCGTSRERDTQCMGIFDQEVVRFNGVGKIPHMGWNRVSRMKGPLFDGVDKSSWFYFVHSYFTKPSEYSAACCDYMGPFSAALQKDNFFAVQFHPEKSGFSGSRILENFCRIPGAKNG